MVPEPRIRARPGTCRSARRSNQVIQRDRVGKYQLANRGSITLRERESIIDRTCARCGSEYEWVDQHDDEHGPRVHESCGLVVRVDLSERPPITREARSRTHAASS